MFLDSYAKLTSAAITGTLHVKRAAYLDSVDSGIPREFSTDKEGKAMKNRRREIETKLISADRTVLPNKIIRGKSDDADIIVGVYRDYILAIDGDMDIPNGFVKTYWVTDETSKMFLRRNVGTWSSPATEKGVTP